MPCGPCRNVFESTLGAVGNGPAPYFATGETRRARP